MLRLRTALERACARRWIGPLVLVVVVVLLALVLVHSTVHGDADEIGALCVFAASVAFVMAASRAAAGLPLRDVEVRGRASSRNRQASARGQPPVLARHAVPLRL